MVVARRKGGLRSADVCVCVCLSVSVLIDQSESRDGVQADQSEDRDGAQADQSEGRWRVCRHMLTN